MSRLPLNHCKKTGSPCMWCSNQTVRMRKKTIEMLTHSYNWIMASLVMRSWEGHTAYWMSYVAGTHCIVLSSSSLLCPIAGNSESRPGRWGRFRGYDSLATDCERSSLCVFTACTSPTLPSLLSLTHVRDIQGQSAKFKHIAVWTESNATDTFMSSVAVWCLFII